MVSGQWAAAGLRELFGIFLKDGLPQLSTVRRPPVAVWRHVCCFLLFLPYMSAQTVAPPPEAQPDIIISPQLDDAAESDDGQPSNSIVFRVTTTLISVPVAVIDASGQGEPNLRSEDFVLKEDGKPVEISQFLSSSRLNIALLFDVSSSVRSNFELEQNAAIDFLKKIWKEGDTVTIISFAERPELQLKNGDNLQEAMWTLRQLRPTGVTTSFFDAVTLAVRILEESTSEGTRQAIVVISDGADNTSDGGFASTLSEIQRQGAVFYAINPTHEAIVRLNAVIRKGQEYLTTFAEATGGAVFVSDDMRDMENIFNKILVELRAQYLLLYYSLIPQMDGKFHTIEVSIPGRPELKVRARTGFLAVSRN